MKKDMVMFGDESAAQETTVRGWVSRHGHFYGDDERAARYSGCTHVECKRCGKPTPKRYLYCDACRDRIDTERYEALELVEWDFESPLMLFGTDQYFADSEDLTDWCEDEGVRPEELKLVLCVNNYVSMDDSHFTDVLTDDGTPDWLEEAISAFNNAVAGQVVSWSPGKQRVSVASQDLGMEPI